jgi:hypothetical protein
MHSNQFMEPSLPFAINQNIHTTLTRFGKGVVWIVLPTKCQFTIFSVQLADSQHREYIGGLRVS